MDRDGDVQGQVNEHWSSSLFLDTFMTSSTIDIS